MSHISPESVKKIRENLKKKFPNVKFSVIRRDYSMVCVSIMESPFDWSEDYIQINYYYPDRYENNEFLKEVIKIVNNDNHTLYYDSDYGNIPKYYISIHVGRWDKPHKKIN